jgi:type I restriction enzyme S subunit
VLTLKRGHDLPTDLRQDGDVPVVSSSGITGYHNQAKATAPGVVTGRYGTLGEVFYLNQDYWPLNTALYVVDFKASNPRFASYFLRNVLRDYQSDKAAVPGVDRKVLHELPVRVPNTKLQVAIADILSAYDDLIENNRRRMELLEEAAQQLYQEWFVRLRFPGHEHIRIINGVPDRWEPTSLGSVADNFDRLRVPLSVFERETRPGSYPYHGAAGIISHIDGYIFDGRFLLVGEDGTVQTSAGFPMLQLVEGRFWVSNHAHVLSGNVVSTEFLYCVLSGYSISGHVTGVAQPKVTQANLNRIPVIVPPRLLRDEFQSIVSALFSQRFVLRAQNDKLRTARDLLLPRLMSGEIAL